MTDEMNDARGMHEPRLDPYFWGIVLIWIGLVFAAADRGSLPQIGQATEWSWIFLGGGIVGLIFNWFGLSSPRFADPTIWDWTWSGLLALFGLGGFLGFTVPWQLVLIIIGAVFLASEYLARR